GSLESFKSGDQVILTQSAMSIEDLIGKFMVSSSPADKKSKDSQ
ncbi:MAG: outer membrane lipid asymmetry maintenance protein MlaD, partial [Xanthomonadales bacterium]|nr:outer membrane lipid asymmetry maintenance protein MlaD [Xanthomonadales bacterium]